MKISDNDPDTLIVSTALHFATERMSVWVIAADNDALMTSLYFWNNEMANILMLSDSAQSKEKSLKVYDIKDIAEKLNQKTLKYLLVIHAFTGCDTT